MSNNIKVLTNSRGFTLIEIMVVILIITVLMSIAIPSWQRSRIISQDRVCVSQLHKIDGAKETWALDNRKVTGDAPAMSDLYPDYLHSEPVCPASGTYLPNPVGDNPTCSIGGSHVL